MKKHGHAGQLCSRFHRAIELIGRRWTGAVLYLLLQSPSGFAQLRDSIPGITDRMLCERLRELEAEGVLSRTVLGGTPVRVRYELTRKGRALADVMGSIEKWGHDWVPAPASVARTKSRAHRGA
jgi:DNA-binding HxlR family transcriptional regulator